LPGFGKFPTFASFQAVGKYNSRKQWINKWVRWTSGFLGRCLRHSLGMPSSPQVFPKFRVRITCCTSQGLTLSAEWYPRHQAGLGHKPSPALHGVRHTGRVVWNDFPKCETGKAMDCGWCPWSIPFHNGLCNNRPLGVILRIVVVTQVTAVLHAGSLVSCHNFFSLRLSYRRRFSSDSSQSQTKWSSVYKYLKSGFVSGR